MVLSGSLNIRIRSWKLTTTNILDDDRGILWLAAQVICPDCGQVIDILPAAECKTKRDIIDSLREDGWREVGNAEKKRWHCSYCVHLKNEAKTKSKKPKKVNQEDIPF